jgi:hypothetical protein
VRRHRGRPGLLLQARDDLIQHISSKARWGSPPRLRWGSRSAGPTSACSCPTRVARRQTLFARPHDRPRFDAFSWKTRRPKPTEKAAGSERKLGHALVAPPTLR